jgi:hypothetical protein
METRWRFLIGLVVLLCSAIGVVFTYPQVLKLLPAASKLEMDGAIGRKVAEAVDLARDYRSYVWSQWFRQNMLQMWALFAVLLGAGGLLSQTSGGGALFTLSLPATRNRLLGIRAVTGLAELLLLALIPSLLLPMLSPSVGQAYGVGDALVHSICMFIGGAIFFSLAFLLSTVFTDVWRPLLIVLCLAAALSLFGGVFPEVSRYSVFAVMSAETYFRGNGVPWLGLLSSAAVSVALLYAATKNIVRQDF